MTKKIKEHAGVFYKTLGSNVRRLRIAQEKSQTDMAKLLGVTFQQVQKYENGVNRFPIESLIKIAGFLNVGLDDLCNIKTKMIEDKNTDFLLQSLSHKEFQVLLQYFSNVKDSKLRASIIKLLENLS